MLETARLPLHADPDGGLRAQGKRRRLFQRLSGTKPVTPPAALG